MLPVGYAPTWSPDGARIAYVTKGDLWTADADGTHAARIVKRRRPARMVAERTAARLHAWRLGVHDPGRRRGRAEARAGAPTQRGRRTACASPSTATTPSSRCRWEGGSTTHRRHGQRPRLRGRTAASRSCATAQVVAGGADHRRGNRAGLVGRRQARSLRPRRHDLRRREGAPPRRAAGLAARRSASRSCSPTSTSAPPTDLRIARGTGRWLLGFTSLVDNIGLGPSIVEGVRPPGATAHDRNAARRCSRTARAAPTATWRRSGTRTRRRTTTGT